MASDPYLYEQIYNHVLGEIRDGTLQTGDRVPSEMELAQRFGVSRITAKRALGMLADVGVLDRRRGKGSFVTSEASTVEPLTVGHRPRFRSRGTSCIALILPNASDAYGLELLYAIEERCDEAGYHLIMKRTRDRQDAEERAIASLIGHELVDGLIVFPVHGEFYNASLIRLVLDGAPLVLVDRQLPGFRACAVSIDHAGAAKVLTEHLLAAGHTELAFISPPTEHTSSIEERLQGYRSALRDSGTAGEARQLTDLRSTLPGSSTEENRQADRKLIREFLRREPAVTGLVACEYNIAVLIRQVLDEDDPAGPDRTIVCFDSAGGRGNQFVHIAQDQRSMGRTAVDLLLAQLAGDEVALRTTSPFALVEPDTD